MAFSLPRNYRELLDAARSAAGVPWPSNCLRHSYASYWLAAREDSAQLALALGHASSGIVFRHYRRVVSKREAGRYWAIRPDAPENVVAMK